MSFLSLSFLAPAALLGLLALAVPIYLHMRHKPRAEAYKFPAIDFLLRAQKKKKRRFHAEQLLLMLFRIGIICLLAVLFSRPYMDDQSGTGSMASNQPLVILLDDSVSMLAGPSSARFFHEAVEQIRDLLRGRAYGAPTRLLTATEPLAYLRFQSSGEIKAALDQLKPSTYAASLDNAYDEAVELIERESWDGAAIRIFTDGSRNAWRELPSRKPEKVEVIYTSMRDNLADFKNLGITSVSQAPGDANSIEVSLLNSNFKDEELELSVLGKGGKRVRQAIRVAAYGRTSHYFGLSAPIPPTLTISLPDDGFDLDNQVIYAPKANKSISVLIVDGDSHPDPISNESFFVRNALGSDDSEEYGYRYEVVIPAGLSKEKVDAADVIFLLNVEVPVNGLLVDALKAGKGLLISMGDRMEFERWNPFFLNYDLEVWEASKLPSPQPVEIKDFSHPFFFPIQEFEWRTYLGDVTISQMRIMSPGRARLETPLTLPSGSPLLMSKQVGQGRMMIWTSTLDIDWTNFPLEFGFVPFIRQVTTWLAGRDGASSYQTLTTNQVREQDLWDQLNLKHVAAPFNGLDVVGPKPGIYTRQVQNRAQFVQVTLEDSEMDFRGLDPGSGHDGEASALDKLGFHTYLRSDLGPSIQWLLFLLVLVETLVATRITVNWGAR